MIKHFKIFILGIGIAFFTAVCSASLWDIPGQFAKAIASRVTPPICEGVAAVLKAYGSKIEYELRHDESNQASAQRFLVTFIRVFHEGLVLYNHHTDYNHYAKAWMAVDLVQLINRNALIHTTHDSEQSPELTAEDLQKAESFMEDVRSVVLPTLEGVAGLVLACCNGNTKESKMTRYSAQSVMSLTRLSMQIFAANDVTQKLLTGLLLIHTGHFLWQALSKFNTTLP
jgi:hypothetical protein